MLKYCEQKHMKSLKWLQLLKRPVKPEHMALKVKCVKKGDVPFEHKSLLNDEAELILLRTANL